MREHTRNRLLGGIVLGSLLLLAVPMLFDEPGIERQPLPRLETPRPPAGAADRLAEFDASAREWNFLHEAEAREQRSFSVQPEYADSAELPLPGSGPLFDARGLPSAWSLQVTDELARAAAVELRDDLVAAHFNAYLEPVGADRYRVLVGPMLDPDRVRALRAELLVKTGSEPGLLQFSLPVAEALP